MDVVEDEMGFGAGGVGEEAVERAAGEGVEGFALVEVGVGFGGFEARGEEVVGGVEGELVETVGAVGGEEEGFVGLGGEGGEFGLEGVEVGGKVASASAVWGVSSMR